MFFHCRVISHRHLPRRRVCMIAASTNWNIWALRWTHWRGWRTKALLLPKVRICWWIKGKDVKTHHTRQSKCVMLTKDIIPVCWPHSKPSCTDENETSGQMSKGNIPLDVKTLTGNGEHESFLRAQFTLIQYYKTSWHLMNKSFVLHILWGFCLL